MRPTLIRLVASNGHQARRTMRGNRQQVDIGESALLDVCPTDPLAYASVCRIDEYRSNIRVLYHDRLAGYTETGYFGEQIHRRPSKG